MKKWGLCFLVVTIVLGACSQGQTKKQDVGKHAQIGVEKKALPKIDHIVIVIEENHSLKQIASNASAPYINSLMKQGANFTNFHGIEHPSQPNYLELFSGSNQGVTNDGVPKRKFTTGNLASELIDKHYSFTGFSENLPSIGFNGATSGRGGYARKHNPWVNFSNVPNKANQPLANFPNDFTKLPTVSFVIPALQNDMHDGTIGEADRWLKQHLSSYVQWAKKHNSLLIVTWDEDDGSHMNNIPTFLVGPMVKAGQYDEKVNHFNLLRTIEDIYSLPHAGEAKSSRAIVSVWK